MGDFRMPSLGADMDAGTIVEWKVHPGDHVHRGDVVAVVDTDKADIDAEIFEDGVIGELLVDVGEKVPVGTVLATVMAEGEAPAVAAEGEAAAAVPEPAAAPAPPPPEPAPTVTPPPPSPPVTVRAVPAAEPVVRSPVVRHLAERAGVDLYTVHGSGAGGAITRADVEAAERARTRPRTSPRARRIAAERGVDLTVVQGTGPGGAVSGADVEAAASPPPVAPVAPTRTVAPAPVAAAPTAAAPTAAATRPDRATTMQQRVAALMERSNREIPHYWVRRDLDFSTSAAWLTEHNAGLTPAERLVPAALLFAATARAAAAVPNMNGWWIDGEFRPAATVDVGIIVVLRGGGLLVPVLREADALTASDTMTRMADLVRRARTGHLRSSELADPSISVSNLGDQGADEVLGVIYPPQVTLVGFGRVREEPWAEHGMLGVRPVVTATVAGDHRATEGHAASRFLAALDQFLQSPASLQEVHR